MNVFIPVVEDKGLKSRLCGHFGSAPYFMLVDLENGTRKCIANQSPQHDRGIGHPLASLQMEPVEGIVVAAIDRGALSRLDAAGIRVFLAQGPTLDEVIAAYRSGALPEATPARARGHGPAQVAGPYGDKK